MDKASLHEGHAYAFRENTRAWERGEDRPIRVTLLRHLGRGNNLVRLLRWVQPRPFRLTDAGWRVLEQLGPRSI